VRKVIQTRQPRKEIRKKTFPLGTLVLRKEFFHETLLRPAFSVHPGFVFRSFGEIVGEQKRLVRCVEEGDT